MIKYCHNKSWDVTFIFDNWSVSLYVLFPLLVLCTVELTKQQGVSLQIEKVGSDPYCEMSINSKVDKKINVAAGTNARLSFIDCPNEDLRLTANKDIGKRFFNFHVHE